MSSEEIVNRYRAFYPWPGSFTFFEGKRVLLEEVKKMTREETQGLLFSGQFIFSKEFKVLFVKTGDHYLEVVQLKPEGKKLLSASDFWNQIPKDKRQEVFFSSPS
jgi:methionyl-tRNA formyltransferase